MIRLTLIDKYNDVSEIYLDRATPAFTDEYGSPAIDIETNPFKQVYDPHAPWEENETKRILDAFLVYPSPGLSLPWMNGDLSVFTEEMFPFFEAVLYLTGKITIKLEKVK